MTNYFIIMVVMKPGTSWLCVLGGWGGWERARDLMINHKGEKSTTPI